MDFGMDDTVCSICLEETTNEDRYKLEQCNHIFHTNCIVRNIQTGNISCPCCRKLPSFLTDVEQACELREDIIYDHNEQQKSDAFMKALDLVKKNQGSNKLNKMMEKYKKEYDRNREIEKLNKEIRKENRKVLSLFRKCDHEENLAIKELKKIFREKFKDIKKENKIKRYKYSNNMGLHTLYNQIVSYVGYNRIDY